MDILDAKVRPERSTKAARKYPRMVLEWWKHFNNRRELTEAVRGMEHVLAVSRVGPHVAFTFLPNGLVYSEALVVFALPRCSAFGVLQSRIHEHWARFFSSTAMDLIRYAPTDCFETFPFPPNFDTDPRLEAVGKAYYEFRAALMVRHNEGLTKTYNHFHNPPSEPTTLDTEQLRDVEKLRALHADMDRAVLDAYGWTDLKPTHEFLLDYVDEEDDDAEEFGRARRRKKPYRYRWPDDFRDEVLMRLLRLNAERAAEEAMHTPPVKPRAPKRNASAPPPSLFG